MKNTFRYTLLELIRMPGVLVWALAFPLILSTIFVFMFSPLDEQAQTTTINLVAVEPDDTSIDGIAFKTFLDAMSGKSAGNADGADAAQEADALFNLTYAKTTDEAARLVNESLASDEPYIGYVELEGDMPHTYVTDSSSSSDMTGIGSSVLVMMMDTYLSHAELFKQLLTDNPTAFADPEFAQAVFEPVEVTRQIQVTDNQPKETVRFYFALLGMAALFGANLGLVACQRLKPNASALGARRALGATSHTKTTCATLLASWAVSFACITIAYGYMRFIAGIDFGGRDLACIATLAVASLTATSLGCAISAIPRVPEDGKSGILTGIVCLASFFAGLYGEPTMKIADQISAQFPAFDFVNPAAQIAQAFYSIMYYDTYTQLAIHLGALLVMALLFFCLSARSLRRQRYASL